VIRSVLTRAMRSSRASSVFVLGEPTQHWMRSYRNKKEEKKG
jgi:hypothetical protein